MSFTENVAEAFRRAEAQGLTISPRVRDAMRSPVSAWSLLEQLERDVIEMQEKTQRLRTAGVLRTSDDFKPYNQLAWTLYKTQMRVWQLILQFRRIWPAGAEAPPPPPDRREFPSSNLPIDRTPPALSGLGTLGNPLAAIPVWMVLAAAFAVIAAAIFIWWVVYQIVVMDDNLRRLQLFYSTLQTCMEECESRGETTQACADACSAAVPTPEEAQPHDPLAQAFPIVFVLGGAAVAVAAIWGAAKVAGGAAKTVVNVSSRDAQYERSQESGFGVLTQLMPAAVLFGGLGAAWWVTSRGFNDRTALRGLGSYPRGLDRGGLFYNGAKHTPERMSLRAFTRGPGTGYDLEV